MQLQALVVDVFESSTKFRYPVIRHVFYGQTRDEAQAYYQAHLKNDAFLRDCTERRQFHNTLCEVDLRWETQQG